MVLLLITASFLIGLKYSIKFLAFSFDTRHLANRTIIQQISVGYNYHALYLIITLKVLKLFCIFLWLIFPSFYRLFSFRNEISIKGLLNLCCNFIKVIIFSNFNCVSFGFITHLIRNQCSQS